MVSVLMQWVISICVGADRVLVVLSGPVLSGFVKTRDQTNGLVWSLLAARTSGKVENATQRYTALCGGVVLNRILRFLTKCAVTHHAAPKSAHLEA
jgi:hypothetical protein